MSTPARVRSFEPTPNPRALKCVIEGSLEPAAGGTPGSVRGYRSLAEAKGDALGERILSIDGVEGVLIAQGFVTITARAGADWAKLKKAVSQAISGG